MNNVYSALKELRIKLDIEERILEEKKKKLKKPLNSSEANFITSEIKIHEAYIRGILYSARKLENIVYRIEETRKEV